VIEHIPEAARALKEIYRVMAPGGVLVLQTPSLESMRIKLIGISCYRVLLRFRILRREMMKLAASIFKVSPSAQDTTEAAVEVFMPQPYDRPLSLGEIKQMVRDAGFNIEKKKMVYYWHHSWIIQMFSLADLFILKKQTN
jgi:ubiquinone/menaquinone biosynthesis C-methylase UbiE